MQFNFVAVDATGQRHVIGHRGDLDQAVLLAKGWLLTYPTTEVWGEGTAGPLRTFTRAEEDAYAFRVQFEGACNYLSRATTVIRQGYEASDLERARRGMNEARERLARLELLVEQLAKPEGERRPVGTAHLDA